MTEETPRQSDRGETFMSKVVASTCHELRNVLAIIRENSGLLADLAGGQSSVPAERVIGVTDRMSLQVTRADNILGRLSRFAHTCDQARATVDLNELVSLLVGLTRRLADMNRVTLEYLESDRSVSVDTDPFALLHVLFVPLLQGIERAGEGGHLRLAADMWGSAAQVTLQGAPGTFSLDQLQEIAAAVQTLDLHTHVSSSGDELAIEISRTPSA